MKVDLPGIHTVKRPLADGSVRVHIYAWRGGPAIKERAGTAAFVLAYEAAHRIKKALEDAAELERQNRTKNFQWVLDEFQKTEEWRRLSKRSKDDYAKKIKIIEKAFATLPLDAFSPDNLQRTGGIMRMWRSKLPGESRRHADYCWTVLARVCSVAVCYGWIKGNPCLKGGRSYEVDRREFIWSEDDIQTLLNKLPEHLHLPVLLALFTGQRPGDLINMQFGKVGTNIPFYKDGYLYVKQRKTKALVKIRAISPIREILDLEAIKRPGGFILVNTRGKRWTSAGFASQFSKLKIAAGFNGLRFYDLRGTAATNLAMAGATNQQIAAITGHSVGRVEAILEAHYIGGRAELAEQAMAKLEEARAKRGNAKGKAAQRTRDGSFRGRAA
jgi:integrase